MKKLRSIKNNKLKIMAVLGMIMTSSLSMATEEMPEICPVTEHEFSYKEGLSSRQITWQSLPLIDINFLRQTGGSTDEEKIKRAVGSVELLLLVRYSVMGKKISENESQKEVLAQEGMKEELNKLNKGSLLSDYITKGTIPFEVLGEIVESVKKDINKSKESQKKKCVLM